MAQFVVEATLATTLNAELFRARMVWPAGDGGAPHEDVVVVKRVALACEGEAAHAAARRHSDDPIQELRVATKLMAKGGHPNVVQFYGAVLESNSTHLVMEYCRDGDLFHRLTRASDNRLPQRDAVDILLHVARGLQYLHSQNIAHCDVSVENVLVRDGVYKLCDFGLSTEADMLSCATVGKAQYMAPEVVAKAPYDPVKADIWSLGILLFILLTGSPLVQLASSSAADFRAFCSLGCRGVTKLWKMDHLFAFATIDLLDRLLQVDPTDRFHSVAEILAHPAMLAAAARERNARRPEARASSPPPLPPSVQ